MRSGRPRRLARGLGLPRRQPLAGAVDGQRPGSAAGDRRGRGARHGAGPGRGDHALDGHGIGGLRAEPARRAHLLRRAGEAAGGDDRRQRRGPLGAPFEQTLYAFAAVLLVSAASFPSPAGTSAAGFAATRSRRYELARDKRRTRRDPAAVEAAAGAELPRPRLPRRDRGLLNDEEIVPWSILDRIGLAAAWFCGLLLCAIAGAIVIYMLVRGLQYVNLSAIGGTRSSRRRPRSRAQRRLPRPDRGHPDPDDARHPDRPPDRRRHRRLAERVRPPFLARPRGRVRRRDRRRDADDRARDLRPAGLQPELLRVPLVHRAGRRRLRALLLHRRDHDVPDRAAAGRGRHPRGAAVDSRPTCARPPTRSARTRSRRSAESCCPPRARGSRPAPRSGWAGSPATRRSS